MCNTWQSVHIDVDVYLKYLRENEDTHRESYKVALDKQPKRQGSFLLWNQGCHQGFTRNTESRLCDKARIQLRSIVQPNKVRVPVPQPINTFSLVRQVNSTRTILTTHRVVKQFTIRQQLTNPDLYSTYVSRIVNEPVFFFILIILIPIKSFFI